MRAFGREPELRAQRRSAHPSQPLRIHVRRREFKKNDERNTRASILGGRPALAATSRYGPTDGPRLERSASDQAHASACRQNSPAGVAEFASAIVCRKEPL